MGLLRSGDADEVPFGVGEMPDDEGSGSALWARLALPAKPHRFHQRGLDVGDAHVEENPRLIALAAAYTTVDPAVGRAPVNEPVVTRLGDRIGSRVVGLELPTEQLAVVAPERCRILTDDLEVHNWLSQGGSFQPVEDRRFALLLHCVFTVDLGDRRISSVRLHGLRLQSDSTGLKPRSSMSDTVTSKPHSTDPASDS